MGRQKSPEKQAEERAQFMWNEALRSIRFCPEPTYQFEVGENPKIGNLVNPKIVNKFFDGKLYLVEFESKETDNYGKPTGNTVKIERYFTWYKLRPKADTDYSFIRNKDVRLSFTHTMIDSILSKKYFFGIDMEPDYQRGYVWTQEDKEKLIDSIFNNIDIGKFALIHKRNYGQPDVPLYEVLDGKQRITAICEFYENRFPYKGKYFNDLSYLDRWHFMDYGINIAEIDYADKATILKYFLILNTSGKCISKEHLAKVEKMYNKIKDNQS